MTDDYAGDSTTTGYVEVDGAKTEGNLESHYDHDWFAVMLTGGERYTFNAVTLSNEVGMNNSLKVFSSSGEKIFPDVDGNFNFWNYTAERSETYYIDYSGYDIVGYNITVTTMLASDRIFDWAESVFPSLFPTLFPADWHMHQVSTEISGYHARLYSNGNALGEKDGNLYFYDGHDINLVGTLTDYLPDATAAGF